MNDNKDDLCGCGKQIRYTDPDGLGSCNKYRKCPSYDELSASYNAVMQDLSKLLTEIQNVLVFREGTSHYEEAVNNIKFIAKKNGFGL